MRRHLLALNRGPFDAGPGSCLPVSYVRPSAGRPSRARCRRGIETGGQS